MKRSRALLLLLVLGCGCPQKPDPNEAPTTAPVKTANAQADDPPVDDPPTIDPDAGPAAVPTGPAGPAGPDRRIPDPEDGIPQTNLLRTLRIQVGSVPLRAWIAERPRSRTLGLMHVKSMPTGRGMLFVYPGVSRHSFWMRNTYIPLSLAYVAADGRIEHILDMEPLTRRSHPSNSAVKFVLEVNQGWFDENGIKVGMRVTGIAGLRGF